MSSSSVTRTSVSYVSENRRSTCGGKSAWSPTSIRPSRTRRTAARVAAPVRLPWRSSCRRSASRFRIRFGAHVSRPSSSSSISPYDRIQGLEERLRYFVDEAVDELARVRPLVGSPVER